MTSQEDDATELQFPKDMETEEDLDSQKVDSELICCSCKSVLQYPHIQCFTCESVTICLLCFTKGKEFGHHENDHSYIIKQNSPVFEKNWKVKEELQLLKAIAECGLGNWSDVNKSLGNKSAEECKNHYFEFYVDNPCDELAALLKSNIMPSITRDNRFQPVIGTDDPPRPLPCSFMFREMAGYNAARSEFTTEYLNDAEVVIDNVEPSLLESDEPYIQDLVVALIDIYRRQLGERSLKKRVIRNHGLINLSKASIAQNHYKACIPDYSDLIPALHTLLSYEEMTYLMESLSHQEDLRFHIRELKECRINGITKQAQVSIYETLKKKRELLKRKKHKLILGPELADVNVKELIRNSVVAYKLPTSLKRATIPIDITGKPEYETLNAEEREISSSLRILPAKFNKIKFGMIEKCRKLNGLQLCHARSHFTIDVNKIRKIYDYLLSEGLIYRPFPNK